MTQSIALVFINTHTKDLPIDAWKNSDGLASALNFFKALEIQDVRVFTDLRKEDIIEQFNKVQQLSDAIEQKNQEGTTFTVIVRWIGWHVELSRDIQPLR